MGDFENYESDQQCRIKYEKVGNVYFNYNIIENSIKEHRIREENLKREKELQCLVKLKAKYESVTA